MIPCDFQYSTLVLAHRHEDHNFRSCSQERSSIWNVPPSPDAAWPADCFRFQFHIYSICSFILIIDLQNRYIFLHYPNTKMSAAESQISKS